MKPKTKLVRGVNMAAMLAELVAKGAAEIAISQISELLPQIGAGIEIVGPLPSDMQDVGAFTIVV